MENKTYVISGVPGRPDLEGLELTWKELDEFTQDPNILEVLSGHVQEVEFPEIPQKDLDISTATKEELAPEQFKFPTFQDMSDALARGWYEVGNNPYIYMWMDETDPVKKAQLERQAEIYQKEMEKNSREAVKDYNENEQSAPAKWLAENLDAFDLATSPISAGLAPAKMLAKYGPLARVGMETVLQGGIEGIHSGIEGENVAGGVIAGGLSGLVPGGAAALLSEATVRRGRSLLPKIKFKEKQATRKEILEQAEDIMKRDKEAGDIIKSRLNRMKDGPLMTGADEAAFVERNMPYKGGYFLGDIRDQGGILTQKGFESDLLDRIISHGEQLAQTGNFPRGELKNFFPSKSTGESPLYGKILDMLPERFDEWGNMIYNYEDVLNAIRGWKPSNASEGYLKTMLMNDYAFGPNMMAPVERGGNVTTLLTPHEKLFEDYPGLGLSALQPLYNAASDPTREAAIEDIYEGAGDAIKGLKGLYTFGHRAVTKPEEVFDEAVFNAFKKEME